MNYITNNWQDYSNAIQLKLSLDYIKIIPEDDEIHTFLKVMGRITFEKYLPATVGRGRKGYSPCFIYKKKGKHIRRTFIAPNKYIQGLHELDNIGEYARKLGCKPLLLISGGGKKRFGELLEKSFSEKGM